MYSQSESIINLTKALIAARREMSPALKLSRNTYHKNMYADLNSVIDATLEPLANNGFMVIQPPSSPEADDHTYVITKLAHTSGEFIMCKLRLYLSKSDMQGLGSAITYARRYSLSSLVCGTQSDDDGNAASGIDKEAKDIASKAIQEAKAKIDLKVTEEPKPGDFNYSEPIKVVSDW